jgi:hypothetical protein
MLEGFEIGEEYLASSSPTGTWSLDTTTVRTGTYSLKINPSSSFGSYTLPFSFDSYGELDTTALTYWSIRFYFQFGAAVSGDTPILSGLSGDTLYLTSASKLKYGSTTGTEVLSVDTWYRIEVREDGSNVVTRINGDQDISVSTTGSAGSVVLGATSGSYTCEFYYDDVAISASDTAGDVDWIGSGGITLLAANAAGDDSDWTGTYDDVEEVPPNEDTDYIYDTAGDHTIALENTSGKIYGTIKAVQGQIIHKVESGQTDKYRFRHKDAGGTAVELDQELTGPTSYAAKCSCRDTDLDGAAWTAAVLDDYQVGGAIDGGNKAIIYITHISAQVEHAGEAKAIGDWGTTTKRTMIDGFEYGSNVIAGGTAGVSYDTGTVRTGTYSGKVDVSSDTDYFSYKASWNGNGTKSSTTYDYISGRFYFRTTDATPSADTVIAKIGTTELELKTTGYLEISSTAGTNQLSDNTWHRIEFIYDAFWDYVFIRVDGNNDLTYSGTISADDDIQLGVTTSGTGTFYYDDVVFFATDDFDAAGWLGAGQVDMVYPDGDSATDTGWTASTGNKYECVDNAPYITSDYVYTTAVEAYSATTANLSGVQTIYAVQAVGSSQDMSSGTDTGSIRIRYSSSTSDTDAYNIPNSTTLLGKCDNKAPDDSVWTSSILDSTEVGVLKVAGTSDTIRCYSLALHVDYVYSAPGPTEVAPNSLMMVGTGI